MRSAWESYWFNVFCLLVLLTIILLPADVFAITQTLLFRRYQGTATPTGDVLCQMASWATGNFGKGFATVGVAIIGIQSYRGEMKKTTALLGIVGIAIIFGAIPIVMGINNFNSNNVINRVLNQPTFSSSPSGGVTYLSYCDQWGP